MTNLLPTPEFLSRYNILEEKFSETGLIWDDLEKIYIDYLSYKDNLEPIAQYMFNTLMKSPNVHSVRYRIKDPEHLIEKIIRKRIEYPGTAITIENYRDEINDLIGLRALHLYKADWESIHDFILKTWKQKEKPTANYRKGDSEVAIEFFKTKDCDTKEHKYGYRSVHYIISSEPGVEKYYAEIQVRTIFEEAWAEIDHTIRYPYDLENPIFFQYLLILNRLAGSADEMGSFILFLKNELIVKELVHEEQLKEKENIINGLESSLEKLKINKAEMSKLRDELQKLKNQKFDYSQNKMKNQNSFLRGIIDEDTLESLNRSTKYINELNKQSGLSNRIREMVTDKKIATRLGYHNSNDKIEPA